MRTTYRVLAYALAAEVMIQAATLAWFVAGLGTWVQGGGVLDKATMESEGAPPFPEVVGIIVHGLNGEALIPAIALALVVVSFFATVPRGVHWAIAAFVLVAVQATLGFAAHGFPFAALLHGLNALLLFAVALVAAQRARPRATAAHPAAEHVEA